MHLTNVKKNVLTLILASGLVAGNFAAISAIAAPSPIVTPGKGISTVATRSTATPSTPSTATRSNSGGGSSSSSRKSSSSYSSSNPVSTSNPGSTSTNVEPVGTANKNAVDPASTAVKPSTKGRLNVPKTADASAMGLYAGLLGLSAVGGAVVLTKKKEN